VPKETCEQKFIQTSITALKILQIEVPAKLLSLDHDGE